MIRALGVEMMALYTKFEKDNTTTIQDNSATDGPVDILELLRCQAHTRHG